MRVIHIARPAKSDLDLPKGPRSEDFKPKEHGAYAILILPIVTAIACGNNSVPGWCVILAAVAGFLSHEPLLIVLGGRGKRAQRLAGSAFRRWLGLVVITSLTGGVALVMGDSEARWSLVGCLMLAGFGFMMAYRDLNRTFGAQLLGVGALSMPVVPLQILAGCEWQIAYQVWAVWMLGFAATTTSVRSIVAAKKRLPRHIHWILLATLTACCLVWGLRGVRPWAVLPMLIAAWWLFLFPPAVRHIRRVGWTLVGVTLLTAVAMIMVHYTSQD
ncbi:MAG: YwiC-like family protein [Planctomycetales bacterium]|nr:YwiC-like family protein [Planctomycetales bacterium]